MSRACFTMLVKATAKATTGDCNVQSMFYNAVAKCENQVKINYQLLNEMLNEK